MTPVVAPLLGFTPEGIDNFTAAGKETDQGVRLRFGPPNARAFTRFDLKDQETVVFHYHGLG
jgi:hypothetical protein